MGHLSFPDADVLHVKALVPVCAGLRSTHEGSFSVEELNLLALAFGILLSLYCYCSAVLSSGLSLVMYRNLLF